MPYRHPKQRDIPTMWLMTDERLGEQLWDAIDRLPTGAGIVFRHYALERAQRRVLFARVAGIARRRHLVLVRAGEHALGRGEAGVHGQRHGQGINTWPVHNRREAVAAYRSGASALLISPVFATRSHPRAKALGPIRAATIGRGLNIPLIALGGMNRKALKRLKPFGFHGWAAIDAWLPPDQKRNAVPI